MAAKPECPIRLPRWVLRVRIFQIVNDIALLGFLIYLEIALRSLNPDEGGSKHQPYIDLQLFIAVSTLPLLICVIGSTRYPRLTKLWLHLVHEIYNTFWWSISFVILCAIVLGSLDSLAHPNQDNPSPNQNEPPPNIIIIILYIMITLTIIQWLTFLITLIRFCALIYKFRNANPYFKKKSLFAISIQSRPKSKGDSDKTFNTKGVSSDEGAAESSEQNEQDHLNPWRTELPSSYDLERSQRPINSRRAELPVTQLSQAYELHGGLGRDNL